jgi:serine phosphatase RsbU (regulator of sigma subunit)
MKHLHLYFILWILIACTEYGLGQNKKIDSLEKCLKNNLSDTSRADILNQLSFQLRNSNLKQALSYAERANRISQKAQYKNGMAESYGYMGLLYYREGKYDLAVDNHLKSLRIYEELGNKRFIGYRYNDLGNVYVEQEFYDRARAYFNMSLSIKEDIKDEDGIVTTMKNIANLYVQQRNYRKVLEISLRTLPKAEKIGNQKTIADLLGFVAESYLHQDSLDKAMEYYDKVYVIRISQNDQYTLPRVLNGIGRVHHKRKDYQKALEVYQKAIDIAQKNNIKVALKRAYEYMSDLYADQKDYATAFKYEKLANAYKDSLYNQKSNDRIAILQSIFDDEKAQVERVKEKELQERKLREREVTIIASSIIAILLAVLTIILWRNNQEKAKRNKVLLLQKLEIETQNRNITASIVYAQRIQQAILPQEKDFLDHFKDSFLIYQPKDIVSGDFYWIYVINNPKSILHGQKIIAVADCTGHGVPGGFMSMIGNDLLDKIVIEREIYNPAVILEVLHSSLDDVLNKEKTDNMDGMEIAICRICTRERKVTYAGSMISLFIADKNGLNEYQADKHYLGGRHLYWTEQPEFNDIEIPIQNEDTMLYLSTDGFQDQLGGEKYRKFSSRRFRSLLDSVRTLPMQEQKRIIQEAFQAWQSDYPQTDDVLILGIQI